jgi:hypothetical protein
MPFSKASGHIFPCQAVPIISQVGNLQVPHFDILSQFRDLLGSFVFNDLNNICVNMDPKQCFNVFVASDDKFVEACAQKWYKETYAEFVKDSQKQFLLPLILYVDETGTDVFQRYPLEPLMFMLLGILCISSEKDPLPGGMLVSYQK